MRRSCVILFLDGMLIVEVNWIGGVRVLRWFGLIGKIWIFLLNLFFWLWQWEVGFRLRYKRLLLQVRRRMGFDWLVMCVQFSLVDEILNFLQLIVYELVLVVRLMIFLFWVLRKMVLFREMMLLIFLIEDGFLMFVCLVRINNCVRYD